ncbi:unnamed protein product, partial [Sphacelaria rigidula]
ESEGRERECLAARRPVRLADTINQGGTVRLTYLLAGCDFLPHVCGIHFMKMWDSVLKAIRTPNLFTKAILADKDGRLTLEMDGDVKLLATVFVFRFENAFAQVATGPG